MPDYIKSNSKSYNAKKNTYNKYCECYKFQSYDRLTLGQDITLCSPNYCKLQLSCSNNRYKHNQYILNQQNLYALMRRKPEIFPIITSVKDLNLTIPQQRQYSNNWYRQFGTSQAIGVNSNVWGGSYICGSEVPYTN